MDKILIIDFMNAVWRANISFPKKDEVRHGKCLDCDALIKTHWEGKEHCDCGANWDYINDKCEDQPLEEHIVVYNFFRNLRPIIELFSPDKCFVVLEGHPQFRYDLFADYKANRLIKQAASKQKNNEKVFKAQEIIVPLLQHLPVTLCRAATYEADDVISSLCENMKEESLVVLSNDSDHIQLLQRQYADIKVYNPIKKNFMEAPTYPYVAWKCLNGDTSDNIPALAKPKKALSLVNDPKLFKQFMDVEENRSGFSINRQLIEFRSVPMEEIVLQEGKRNFSELKSELDKMKFESLTNDKTWDKYVKTFDCVRY